MQSDKILSELKGLAEKIGIKVTEQVLKSPGIHVRSGLCKVRGEDRFILDKKLNMTSKIDLLADCLCMQDTNGVFLIPQIRDLLAKHKKRSQVLQQEEAQETGNLSSDFEARVQDGTEETSDPDSKEDWSGLSGLDKNTEQGNSGNVDEKSETGPQA